MKKAQVSLYIILGLVILAFVWFISFSISIKGEDSVTQDQQKVFSESMANADVSGTINSCLSFAAIDSISRFGIRSETRNEYESLVASELRSCVLPSLNRMREQGFEITEGRIEADAEQEDETVTLTVHFPLKLKKDSKLQEFDKFREKIFAANETFLMDLIAEVAGMIVLKEIQLDRDYVKRLVITLLQHLSTKEDIKIQLSEADFANVEALRQALEKEFGKLNNTTIDINPDMPVGGCKIETRFGVVDATVASQIENVKEALRS